MSHAMTAAIVLLIVCFIIRLPIAIGMLISSGLYLILTGADVSLVAEIFSSKMYNNFILLAVPLFIFAANIMNSSKVTDKIFDFAKVLVGRWKGGLGHVNVFASLIFSGMTGSAVADASGLGIMEIEAMGKEGYDDGFSAAITASSAVIGPIFPPSIPLVIYGVIAGASIGNLFLAGMVPGVLLAIALMIYVAVVAHKRKYPVGVRYTIHQFLRMTFSAIPALLTPIILLMGIYTGIMTATEAGAVAALYALIISVFAYRSMTLGDFLGVLKNTVRSTGQIGIMLGAAYVFSYIIAIEKLPELAGNLITTVATSRITFLIFVNIALFILGMLLDSAVLQLVLLPILCPIAQSYGIDMVHFGVVFTLNTMIGLCTPPFGMLLFIVTGISGEKMKVVIREIMPMVVVMIIVLLLVTFVPDVIMWLPRLFGR
ncbi:MAG: TRAP transporter large permease [Lachnospiraceae bacterium]|jgi:tripartite ATP-independent transporter DctM subunit|nr:TRAP transporter large permease [Lachnospiraceae bacterium]MCI9132579.1 TRAP transporter large permease [Lachnospiraceae bacterium]